MARSVRPPAVAGAFYPGKPASLRAAVESLLAAAPGGDGGPWPRALIAPHAGYVYSGPVAATAWSLARGGPWRRVLLVGPAHHAAGGGLILPQHDALATPLGEVPIDPAGATALLARPGVVRDATAHAQEHSLEVQLPFLQICLPAATVLPLLVGDAEAARVADAIDAVWDDTTLVVVSTDLSHFLDHASATARDRRTCDAILAGRGGDLDWHDACGRLALAGLLRAATARGHGIRLLDYRNSGDTAGSRDRVVGYAAFVIR